MRLFRFRPRDGWRVFAGEVGVIVLGVLIALGAQQVADDWQWRRTAAATRDALDDELRGNAITAAERIAIAPCLRDRLSGLSRKLAATTGAWRADPFVARGPRPQSSRLDPSTPPVYRIPARSFVSDNWDQAKADGALPHLGRDDVTLYSQVYDLIRFLRDTNQAEQAGLAGIAFLAYDGPMDTAERNRALNALFALDLLQTRMRVAAEQLIETVMRRGGRLSGEQTAALKDTLQRQYDLRGQCVDIGAAMRAFAPPRKGAR